MTTAEVGHRPIRDVLLSDLKINQENPRAIRPERLEDLKASLVADRDMLSARPVIAAPDGTVIAGNMRVVAARELGWDTIPVVTVDLDNERARLWMLKDNQSYGDWVEDEVGALLQELARTDVDLNLTGFAPEEIDRLLEATTAAVEHDPDWVPQAPDAKAKAGDVWALGQHRVMCADATDAQALKRLVGNHKVSLVWTDPPYAVDYEGKTKKGLRIENDDLTDDAHEALLHKAFAAALGVCRAGAVWYVTAPSAPPQVMSFVSVLSELGIWQQTLIWVKDTFVLGRSDFHYRHELLLYGWKEGRHRRPPERCHDTVWEVARPRANRDHPTAKPVSLVERALRLSSRPHDTVLDPFLGSGTTVVACERTHRRCVGMELDPRYLDVTIARFEALTGKQAVRLTTREG